jgi:hypothetical protein
MSSLAVGLKLALPFMLMMSCAIGSPPVEADGGTQGADAGIEAVDAGPPLGSPGAPVWLPSSTGFDLSFRYFYQPLFGSTGGSGSRCSSFERAALSSGQAEVLSTLKLQPFNDGCSADGYEVTELVVRDVDGGRAVYSDTGCAALKVPEARALLPRDLSFKLAGPNGTPCR